MSKIIVSSLDGESVADTIEAVEKSSQTDTAAFTEQQRLLLNEIRIPREGDQPEENSKVQLRSEKEQQVKRMEEQLREKDRELENSERQLREREFQEASLHEQLREKGQQEQNSQKQLRRMQQQLKEKDKQEKNLQDRLREMEQEQTNLRGQLRDKQDETASLQEQVTTQQRELIVKDRLVNELVATLSSAQQAVSYLRRAESPLVRVVEPEGVLSWGDTFVYPLL